MMKRVMILFTAWALVLGLCACKSSGTAGGNSAKPELTYQDYYDLGVRYLSEGNYEEAIIAFTAAIEIAPKQAPAYVGRGDAYVLSGETERNLAAAQADYEKAIELNEASAEAYLGLADVYIRQGAVEKALEILVRGLEKTGNDQTIISRITEMQGTLEIETGETILFSQYNIEDFVSEEEFAMGGIPFYELTLIEASSYLSKLGGDGTVWDHGGMKSCYVSRHVDDSTAYAIITCDQYSGSQTINCVQYSGNYHGRIIEEVKTEIRDISIGDSMGTVLEKIGMPTILSEALVRTGLSITIGANHGINGGYGWITVRQGGSSIDGKEAQEIYIMADHSTCAMYFIKDELVGLQLQAQ